MKYKEKYVQTYESLTCVGQRVQDMMNALRQTRGRTPDSVLLDFLEKECRTVLEQYYSQNTGQSTR